MTGQVEEKKTCFVCVHNGVESLAPGGCEHGF